MRLGISSLIGKFQAHGSPAKSAWYSRPNLLPRNKQVSFYLKQHLQQMHWPWVNTNFVSAYTEIIENFVIQVEPHWSSIFISAF